MQAVADRYHTRCAELIFFLRFQFMVGLVERPGSALGRSKETVGPNDRSKYARKYRLRFTADSEAQSLMVIVSALNGWLGVPSIISFR